MEGSIEAVSGKSVLFRPDGSQWLYAVSSRDGAVSYTHLGADVQPACQCGAKRRGKGRMHPSLQKKEEGQRQIQQSRA